MSIYQKKFKVANPSPYERSDYVEVGLETLGVPPELDENSLKLFRLYEDNKSEEIPYQIDCISGNNNGRRFMTFFSKNTTSGSDDYGKVSARYLLEEGKPSYPHEDKENLWVGHYYEDSKNNEPKDGFNKKWYGTRKVKGVKFYNNKIEFYFSLVPGLSEEVNFTGAVTNLHLKEAREKTGSGEMLAIDWEYTKKRWGQLTHLAFFPLPWRTEWFQKISMLENKYNLIYSKSGPIKAIVTLKSESLEIKYIGTPYFDPESKNIKGNLYRIIHLYPETSFYMEDIFLQTENGVSLSFRPYYSSFLYYPNVDYSQLHKNVDYSQVPDDYMANPSFFTLWKHFSRDSRGFGFASNIRIRSLEFDSGEIQWRLPNSHHNRCIHFFMYNSPPDPGRAPLHTIGHEGWYEKIFRPLEVIPLSKRFPTHIPKGQKTEVW
jgi:hypothetical protein